MTEYEARDYLRSLDPAASDAARKGWATVNDEMVERAAARRPRPKVFEVHHEATIAQMAFLAALKAGVDEAGAQNAARRAITLPELEAA